MQPVSISVVIPTTHCASVEPPRPCRTLSTAARYASSKVVSLPSTQHLIPRWSGCAITPYAKERSAGACVACVSACGLQCRHSKTLTDYSLQRRDSASLAGISEFITQPRSGDRKGRGGGGATTPPPNSHRRCQPVTLVQQLSARYCTVS